MLNLALAMTLIPAPEAALRNTEQGVLGKLILWARQQVRYHQARHELHKLDDRDLDDLDIARVDFPELAWRHATGAAPLVRPYR